MREMFFPEYLDCPAESLGENQMKASSETERKQSAKFFFAF